MVGSSQQPLAGNIASAMAWWRDAGVDYAYVDEATSWIAPPPPPVEETERPVGPQVAQYVAPPPPPRERIGGDAGNWPKDLATFQQWWMKEPSLDNGQVARRVPPRGVAGAEMMILVEQCEAEDGETLLSARQGGLLSSMLKAMGIGTDRIYLSPMLVRHTPLPDWTALNEAGLGEMTRHHIGLVAPRRLIAFGGNILPLLGHDPAQSAQNLPAFNHEGRSIPLLAAHGLDALGRANAKAAFWRRWLDWTGKEVS